MVLSAVLDVLVPQRCAGCGELGAACCRRCTSELSSPAPIACGLGDVPAFALAPYAGVARKVVLAYKERGRRDLATALGGQLARGCLHLPALSDSDLYLVPVPSRRAASRMRGGPHVLRLARRCAAALATAGRAAAVAPALRLAAGARDAAGLSRTDREANLAGRVRVVPAGLPPAGTSVVLVDDVVTTGATARACVRALGSADVGVAAVLALTSPARS